MPRRRLKSKTSGTKERSESPKSKRSVLKLPSKPKLGAAGAKKLETPKTSRSAASKKAILRTPNSPETPKTGRVQKQKSKKASNSPKKPKSVKLQPPRTTKTGKSPKAVKTPTPSSDRSRGPKQPAKRATGTPQKPTARISRRTGASPAAERRPKGSAVGKENLPATPVRTAAKSTAPVAKRSPAPVVDRGILFLQRNPDKTESRKKTGHIKTPVKNTAADDKILKAAAQLC